MRIEKIILENLNSLVGRWRIDLNETEYKDSGIFAIVGPTGSGKSTILDAISLGLYGKTPRLNRIAGTNNEIMSRQSGECMVEVTFSTKENRYRCHWSQHTAGKKPKAKLQTKKHLVIEVSTGKQIVEDKGLNTSKKVEEITGMDFDRFTRSVLLAQGSFDKFLKSKSTDRSPILEDITGTKIYSEISMKVHECHRDKKTDLEKKQEELKSFDRLSEEDIKILLSKEQELEKEQQIIDDNTKRLSKEIDWLDKIFELNEKITRIRADKGELEIEIENFKNDQKRLDRAEKASELEPYYKQLKTKDSELESLQKRRGKLASELIRDQESRRNSEVKLSESKSKLEKHENLKKERLPSIEECRKLDIEIDGLKKSHDKIKNDYNKKLIQFRGNNDLIQKDNDDLDSKNTRLAELNDKLLRNSADKTIIEKLQGIENDVKEVSRLDATYETNRLEIINLENKERMVGESLEKKQYELKDIEDSLKESEEKINNVKKSQSKLIGQNNILQLRRNRDTLLVDDKNLTELINIVEDLEQKIEDIDERKRSITSSSNAKREILVEIKVLEKHEQNFQVEINKLKQKINENEKIKSLEDHRHDLRPGIPCPLCGSKDHPFAEQPLNILDNDQINLEQKRMLLKENQNMLSDKKVDLKTTKISLETLAKEVDNLNTTITRLVDSKINKKLKDLFPDISILNDNHQCQELSKNLHIKKNATLEKSEQLTSVISEWDDLEQNLKKLNHDLITGKDDKSNKEQAFSQLRLKHQQIKERHNAKKKEIEKNRQDKNACLDRITTGVSEYGYKRVSVENLNSITDELRKRKDNWETWSKETVEIAPEIEGLISRIKTVSKQNNELSKELSVTEIEISKFELKLKEKRKIRVDLLGDRNPQNERQNLETNIENATSHLNEVKEELNIAENRVTETKTKLDSCDNLVVDISKKQKTLHNEFRSNLERSEFSTIEDFVKSILPSDERNQLRKIADRLKTDSKKFENLIDDYSRSLNVEKNKNLTNRPKVELEELRKKFETSSQQKQQEVGAIKEKLRKNSEDLEEYKDLSLKLKDQEKEFSLWNDLNSLIGSHDGKKYREFAQTITFRVMVGHANKQLSKMNDRYLLEVDDEKSLELNVKDMHQGGEIRTTKNLSGGESFIVSLALALGMSEMASQKVQVDSLFLDEGFGTLDEDALSVALDALGNLKHENKIIGLISHIPSVKERIYPQIEVVQLTGGRSKLKGPGCIEMR